MVGNNDSTMIGIGLTLGLGPKGLAILLASMNRLDVTLVFL